jgi:hypothetical protein
MALEYVQPTYIQNECKCQSHSLHVLFSYLIAHPGVSLKDAARDLRISHQAARQRKSRLTRRPDLSRLCPGCFSPSLRAGVCQSCGYEMDRPDIPLSVDFKSQSPRYSVQPLNGLGSHTDYLALKFQYGGRNIAHLVERPGDPLLERCKSELWQALKEVMPTDEVTEEAARLLTKEVREFESRYPALVHSTKTKGQIVRNVLTVMQLRYPALKKCDGVTYVLQDKP